MSDSCLAWEVLGHFGGGSLRGTVKERGRQQEIGLISHLFGVLGCTPVQAEQLWPWQWVHVDVVYGR